MSQLSFEQQVKGIVSRANFTDSEINDLVKDVAQIDVNAVAQRAEALQHLDSATPRDVQNADMVLGSIARLKSIDQRREISQRDARQKAQIQQAANHFDRTTLK
jgi:hypothetical protein